MSTQQSSNNSQSNSWYFNSFEFNYCSFGRNTNIEYVDNNGKYVSLKMENSNNIYKHKSFK